MIFRKKAYKHDVPIKLKRKLRSKLAMTLAIILFFGGAYLLFLTQFPGLTQIPVSTSIDLNTADDATNHQDRIQIEKINLEVPFFGDNTPAVLEKGAWWRFPERGNPKKGGNFILSAHRFNLGLTPQGTRAKSPFYNLDQVQSGDKVRVSYKDTWYEYEVIKKYSVEPTAVEIEAPSDEPKLTLYTCSLKGAADGRVVVIAKPMFEGHIEQSQRAGASPLL